MEGKYTKFGTIIGAIALMITIWQVFPNKENHLDGEWKMVTKIDKSSLSTYEGMTVEWKMFICENENIIRGTAEKIKINDIVLDTKGRTSIEFEGNVKDENISINFKEKGKLRETTGIILANLENDKFIGTFSQSAANTTGQVLAIKLK